jgi:hypothetical protein
MAGNVQRDFIGPTRRAQAPQVLEYPIDYPLRNLPGRGILDALNRQEMANVVALSVVDNPVPFRQRCRSASFVPALQGKPSPLVARHLSGRQVQLRARLLELPNQMAYPLRYQSPRVFPVIDCIPGPQKRTPVMGYRKQEAVPAADRIISRSASSLDSDAYRGEGAVYPNIHRQSPRNPRNLGV